MPTEEGNIITFSDTTEGNTFFYQKDPFIGFSHVQGMYPKGDFLNEFTGLFLCTILIFINTGRFTYGRKMRRDLIADSFIYLPQTFEGKPDWETIEDYMENLHSKPITTEIKSRHIPLNTEKWGRFKVKDLFYVRKGKRLTAEDQTEGNISYIGAIDSNTENSKITLIETGINQS